MYNVEVNGNSLALNVQLGGGSFSAEINGKNIAGSLVKLNDYQYNIIYNDTSYNLEVVKINKEEKTVVIKINSVKFSMQLKDKFDMLLKSLGMDNVHAKKISDIKAPMPGMVLNILVEEGAQVKKGDALIVLEAMKMENILKSPSDGVIKKIVASKGKAVEKNQVLIQF